MAGHPARRDCQLYLILEVHAATRDHLAAILARADIASVLFRPARGAALTAHAVKPLVELAQGKDAAALLLDDITLARTLRADGVHLSPTSDVMARYDEARSVLGTRANIGADAGGSRHVAMELGEAGCDYVAFSDDVSLRGPIGHADAGDDEIPKDLLGPLSKAELVAWWGEVFEVPCVAFDVADTTAALIMAKAGADFVAMNSPVATSPAAVAAWVTSIRQDLERADA